MRESKTLEFKETISSTFLKTVSAFANYDGGKIVFGVADGGEVVGLENPTDAALVIENKINDSIVPQPDYSIDIKPDSGVVELNVSPGKCTPYLYKSKAFKRNDTSTIEVDRTEYVRLDLAGINKTYEQLPARVQNLEFDVLSQALKEQIGLVSFNEDTLKTLNLVSSDGDANIAAELLADTNTFPGVDVAVFGDSIDIIKRRETYGGISVLAQLDLAMEIFSDEYCYEQVVGFKRIAREAIPSSAFREALANALVHRQWDESANINVAMFKDRIEIASPGGLPAGLSVEAYLDDMVSIRRNPILANVFYRLGIIEAFGTGIRRIKDTYAHSIAKPEFFVRDASLKIVLPVLLEDLGIDGDELRVYDALSPRIEKTSTSLVDELPFGRTKTSEILNALIAKGLAVKTGEGRATRYKRNC